MVSEMAGVISPSVAYSRCTTMVIPIRVEALIINRSLKRLICVEYREVQGGAIFIM